MDDSVSLYLKLCEYARSLNLSTPASFVSLFNPEQQHVEFYESHYEKQRNTSEPVLKRPGDETCNQCAAFFLTNRKAINKDDDVVLGNTIGSYFCSWLETVLRQEDYDVSVVRADIDDFHMPDYKVVNNTSQTTIVYFEFKFIFRPFLKIAQMVSEDFECYSHSLTLDLTRGDGNKRGNKLQEQRERVEEIGVNKVAYVYWYDIPCLKGIFWMPARRVYEHMDHQSSYERRNVDGDYNDRGNKVAATQKIYLPLTEMNDLERLLRIVKDQYKLQISNQAK